MRVLAFRHVIFKKIHKNQKIVLAFFCKVCYYIQALRCASKYPGVAKFGIALEWGSRGLEFESRHSDQKAETVLLFLLFSFVFQAEISVPMITFRNAFPKTGGRSIVISA